jgi:hypothetical protein
MILPKEMCCGVMPMFSLRILAGNLNPFLFPHGQLVPAGFICIPGSRELISYCVLLEPKRRISRACHLPGQARDLSATSLVEFGQRVFGREFISL